jgi:hypothetical protein
VQVSSLMEDLRKITRKSVQRQHHVWRFLPVYCKVEGHDNVRQYDLVGLKNIYSLRSEIDVGHHVQMFFYKKKPPIVSSLLQSDPWTMKSNMRVFLAAGLRLRPRRPPHPPSMDSAFAALRPPPLHSASAYAVQGLLPGHALAPASLPWASAGRRYPSRRTWLRCPPAIPGSASLPLDLPPSRSSSCSLQPSRPRGRAPRPSPPRPRGRPPPWPGGRAPPRPILHSLKVEFSVAKSLRRLAVSLPSPPQPQG